MVLGRPKGAPALALIDRYLARKIAVPLLGTLILAAMLLVLDKMLRLFDFVVTAGGPVSVVWRMLANLLPEYFSLGIPIGLMLGILLAFASSRCRPSWTRCAASAWATAGCCACPMPTRSACCC